MRSTVIKIKTADLTSDGERFLNIVRMQSSRLVTLLEPRAGVINASVNNQGFDNEIRVRIESALSYGERVRRFGVANLEQSTRSGKISENGIPIPTEDWIASREHLYPLGIGAGTTWLLPKPLLERAWSEPDDGAAVINAAAEALDAFCVMGGFRVWQDSDWVSQSEAVRRTGVAVKTLENAIRDGRLATWMDVSEPNPRRRTRMRLSEVIRRWGVIEQVDDA